MGGERRRKRRKAAEYNASSVLCLSIFISICCVEAAAGAVVEDDVRCLRGVKSTLSDTQGKLDSWNFSNTSVGFICRFVGATCWNEAENRLIDLRLPNMALSGPIPDSFQFCPSINALDLSNNALSGPIPSAICDWLPYLVHLDLSGNNLEGPIPPELLNCKFINTLILNNNRLSGTIPYQLSRLNRLKRLAVANNGLSGAIPSFLSSFDPADFQGNDGLCGRPLSSHCGGIHKTGLALIIAAGVFGATMSVLLGCGLWWLCFIRRSSRRKRRGSFAGDGDESWVEKLRPHRVTQVVLFQKPLVKVKLADLMAATNNFDPDNILFSSRTGTSYCALLPDGSALIIKRLHFCKVSDKHFCAEMNRLGQQLRHRNLVPLLGYCIAADEKLLVYKHMPNGTLCSALHKNNFVDAILAASDQLDWPTRLKIGIGAARGLAWLHHSFQFPFLHQNISSNSILLDEDYDARITDFGLARLINSADTNGRSTCINGDFGDFGYVAPEYASTLVASLKGDVYGFGVVMLELVTGQKPLVVCSGDDEFKGNLVDWVNRLSSAGRIKDAIDKSLIGKGHEDEILEFLHVGSSCVTANPKDRLSMHQVYQSLKNIGKGYDFSQQFDEMGQR